MRLLVAEQWQKTEPDLRVLDDYQPGDALGMVCGHKLDGVDTDPRTGGDKSRGALEADGPCHAFTARPPRPRAAPTSWWPLWVFVRATRSVPESM